MDDEITTGCWAVFRIQRFLLLDLFSIAASTGIMAPLPVPVFSHFLTTNSADFARKRYKGLNSIIEKSDHSPKPGRSQIENKRKKATRSSRAAIFMNASA